MALDPAQAWHEFQDELESRAKRLLNEVESAWADVRNLTHNLWETANSRDWLVTGTDGLELLEVLFGDCARQLLHDPLGECRKRWPLLRVLSATDTYESGLDDLARQLPSRMEAPLGDFVRIVRPDVLNSGHGRWYLWRNSLRVLPLRDIVLAHFRRQSLRRARLDGAMQLLLAQACLHLLGPWQDCRHRAFSGLLGIAPERWERERLGQWWTQTAAEYEASGERLLHSYRRWTSSVVRDCTSAVRRRIRPLSRSGQDKQDERRGRFFAYWSRQQRAVSALVDLERQMANVGSEIVHANSSVIDSVTSERGDLLAELDQVLEWLRAWQAGERNQAFPPPSARLLSAEERARDWIGQIWHSTGSLLPAVLEGTTPRRALPGWRDPFRRLEPAKTLHVALEQAGRPVVIEGLKEAEAAHRGMVREIERAREVVAFGIELESSSAEQGTAFGAEAVANAMNLLLYQKRSGVDPRPSVQRGLVRGQALALQGAHINLEESRLGALAYLARQRGERRVRQVLEFSRDRLRTLSQKIAQWIERTSHWALLKAGWITPPPSPLEPVTERAFLGQILDVQFGVRDLPALYRRLFRLAPVEDPRFLVGRDAEMQGIMDAVERWRSGQFAAVVVIGARGSGKTSLLNCAASSVLSGLPVVASQFCIRVSQVDQLDRFLKALFQAPETTNLQAALSEGRHVVVLEELERTFLRKANGFEAIRTFLRLVEATSKATLWILSINETSFRYLDAAVSLGATFSHRINAMSVSPEHITNAILQRHNLSGLRLEFTPLPEGDLRLARLRRFVGLEQDPRELFFRALYGQSEGIFRSAFELWQDCIERVEGGVVHMRHPLDPDYRPLLRELAPEDLFTLQAILQHGGLEADHLAQVFGSRLEESQRRIDRLRALDILEPDPGCPGFRVRPQAGRFVRDALHRSNLW